MVVLKASLRGSVTPLCSFAELEDFRILNKLLGRPARLIVSYIPLLSMEDPASGPLLPSQCHCLEARGMRPHAGHRIGPM